MSCKNPLHLYVYVFYACIYAYFYADGPVAEKSRLLPIEIGVIKTMACMMYDAEEKADIAVWPDPS